MKYIKKQEDYTLKVPCKRYTVNGKPTCMTYFGKDECIFLGWNMMTPVRTFTMEKLSEEEIQGKLN